MRAASPLTALDFRRPKALRGGEGASVVLDLFEAAAAADGDAHHRIVRHVHRDLRLPPEAFVEEPEQGAAAREYHTPIHDVRGELRRCAIQGVPNRRHDSIYRDADRLPNLLTSYDYSFGQTRDEVSAPYLGRLLAIIQKEGAPELHLQLLSCLRTDGELVLLLDVRRDRIVYVVTSDPYGRLGHDTTQGDHRYLAGPATDIDDHGPLGLIDRHPRPYCRGERLLNGVRLPRSRRLRRLLNRPKLHARDSTRDAHHDPRPRERTQDPALRLRFADKVREHLLCNLEVRYDPVLQGAHGHDVAGCASEHPLSRPAHGDDLVGLVVYGNHRGLREDDPFPLNEYQRIRRAQVHRDVPA